MLGRSKPKDPTANFVFIFQNFVRAFIKIFFEQGGN